MHVFDLYTNSDSSLIIQLLSSCKNAHQALPQSFALRQFIFVEHEMIDPLVPPKK